MRLCWHFLRDNDGGIAAVRSTGVLECLLLRKQSFRIRLLGLNTRTGIGGKRTAKNIFAIQAEMAIYIAEALQATLSPQELDTLNRVPTQSLVPVRRLALDGMLFEVDAIAVLY
jgi:hypothetical protein